jgi:Tfp pilus assembly protein PilV
VNTLVPALGKYDPSAARRVRREKGFTLVEVLVATVLLTMVILGILSVLIGSYRVAAKARYRDHARYVIKSIADQFLTGQPYDSSGNAYPVYTPTVDGSGNSVALGTGMTWTNTDGTTGSLASDNSSMTVLLGDNSGAPITAQVTRTVTYLTADLSASYGQQTLINQNAPPGYILQGTFTINYNFLGQAMPPIAITVLRAMP